MKKIDPTLEKSIRSELEYIAYAPHVDWSDHPVWEKAAFHPEIEPLLLEYLDKMNGMEFLPMVGLLICDPNNPRYREMLKTKEIPYDDDEIDDIIREYHKEWQPCKK